jgi:GNAT superfamily N-acetyltransferase
MSALATTDLSSLAALAQTRDGDLRPLLLRSQTELFVTGPRDSYAIATYEALALGLIPLVGREVVAEIAQALDGIHEAPARVRAALADRLHDRAGAVMAAPTESEADPDLAAASDPESVLDGHELARLVDAARARKDLARALLARRELTVFDRAALYRFADDDQRAAIRDELGRRLPTESTSRLTLPADIRNHLLATPDGRRTATMLANLGLGPSVEAARSGLAGDPAEQELFAMALLMLGLEADECMPLFLTLDPDLSHSVDAIFRLVRLARATPRQVAAHLAGEGRPTARDGSRHRPGAHPAGAFDRAAPARGTQPLLDRAGGVRGPESDPARRGREATAPLGHRSKATTSRDRT